MRELDIRFGPAGKWRAMVRFAVEKNDAIRACDNAKGSKHNVCTSVGDKLLCEKADMPQALAELFYTFLAPGRRGRMQGMHRRY